MEFQSLHCDGVCLWKVDHQFDGPWYYRKHYDIQSSVPLHFDSCENNMRGMRSPYTIHPSGYAVIYFWSGKLEPFPNKLTWHKPYWYDHTYYFEECRMNECTLSICHYDIIIPIAQVTRRCNVDVPRWVTPFVTYELLISPTERDCLLNFECSYQSQPQVNNNN